ncbi:hypothetical protein PanWU01x14_251410 [Parasponia andersonii]|uniref:Uncharacterized protein n=1 Tax=Parasponia andersonii TaxID=3476 RepID=A0A2P5BCH6_PARAD|nr:hypothetical protein PanWU01x14_251410 [Parasponia andersonii]
MERILHYIMFMEDFHWIRSLRSALAVLSEGALELDPRTHQWDQLFGKYDENCTSLKTEGFWVRYLQHCVKKDLAGGFLGDGKVEWGGVVEGQD